MKNTSARAACIAAGAMTFGGLIAIAPIASATAFHPPNPAGHVFDLGPSPTGVGNCSFPNNDASFSVVSGNAVVHNSGNKNGDWGGSTFEGLAIFQEAPFSGFDSQGNPIDTGPPVQLYEGKLTFWEGFGQNSIPPDPNSPPPNQSEFGETANFHGTALSGSGTLDLHVNVHATNNNSGTPTAFVINVNANCS